MQLKRDFDELEIYHQMNDCTREMNKLLCDPVGNKARLHELSETYNRLKAIQQQSIMEGIRYE